MRAGLVAFELPLAYVYSDKFNQPIFGANNLSGKPNDSSAYHDFTRTLSSYPVDPSALCVPGTWQSIFCLPAEKCWPPVPGPCLHILKFLKLSVFADFDQAFPVHLQGSAGQQ